MHQIFSLDSPFMKFLGKVADLLILDLLWLVCSLPIVTIGATTTALYYSCLKMIKEEEGSISRTFFKAFKSNFKQATVIWLIALVALLFLAFDFAASMHLSEENVISGSIFFGIFVLLAVVLSLLLVYAFPLLAQFSNTAKRTMVNAIVLGVSHLGRSIVMLIIDAILIYFGFIYLPVAIPVVPVFVNCIFLQGVFKKYLPAEQAVD